jgi:hypothetical protein
LRIARLDVAQRYGGQMDAGSWTARILARLGGAAAIAVLMLACLAPAAARAAKHAPARDPSPQAAPVSNGGSPGPDPAPQAASHSTVSHASTTSTPSIRQTTSVVSTRHPITVNSSPVAPARTASAQSASHSAPARSSLPPARPSSHKRVRHAPATRPTSPRVGSLSFPLALPRELLLLPRAALRAGAPDRQNGVLLLLSGVAMAVVAVAGYTLLRRLKRLEAV